MKERPKSHAQQAGCTQAEAFCLMLYRDERGNEEWIWNSRDAVTPFCISLRNGNEAMHVEWSRDRFDPWHVPKVGDRIFVNLTMEHARGYRRTYVERWWDDAAHGEAMSARYESKEDAVEKLARADYESFGAGVTPSLAEVTEELLAILKSTRVPPLQWRPRGFA